MNDLTHNESQNGSPKSQECLILILEIGVACSMEFSRKGMNMSGIIIELNSIRRKLLGTNIQRLQAFKPQVNYAYLGRCHKLVRLESHIPLGIIFYSSKA